MGNVAVLAPAGGFVVDGHAAPDGQHRTPYDQHPAAFVDNGVGESAEFTENGVGKTGKIRDLQAEIRRFGKCFGDPRFPDNGLLFGNDQHNIAVRFRNGLFDKFNNSGRLPGPAAPCDIVEHFMYP